MKHITTYVALLLVSMIAFCGCGQTETGADSAESSKQVVKPEPKEPPPSDKEIVVLCYYYKDAPRLPIADAMAKALGTDVVVDKEKKSVAVELGGKHFDFIDYGNDVAVMKRLQQDPPPVAAVLLISAMYGPFDQHEDQLAALAKAKVPVLATVYDEVSKIDDEELLDLQQMEIDDIVKKSGYENAKVVRTNTALVVEGDEDAINAFQAIVTELTPEEESTNEEPVEEKSAE